MLFYEGYLKAAEQDSDQACGLRGCSHSGQSPHEDASRSMGLDKPPLERGDYGDCHFLAPRGIVVSIETGERAVRKVICCYTKLSCHFFHLEPGVF